MVFPVKPKYTIGPDIVKYDGEVFSPVISESYIREKEKELFRLEKYLCKQEDESVVRILGDYCGVNSFNIKDIGLRLEEDVAVMKDGKLSAICFCFPSGFSPDEIVGKSFYQIHEPVPESERLRKSSDNITTAMSREGSKYRRYVWTLSSLSSLSQHPRYERPIPESIDDIYFRTEVQTTVGMGNNISLFFVRVEMTPLNQICVEHKEIIRESINSMSDSILEYKGLKKIKEIISNVD